MSRKKLYYPVSDIETNLYASLNQLQLEDGKPYIGQYHRYISTGEYFTGPVWDIKTSKKLVPSTIIESESIKTFKRLKNIQTKFITPKSSPIEVTKHDISRGYIKRFFLYRNTDRMVLEIDSEQYELWQKEIIDNNIYSAISVNWYIVGELYTTIKNGIRYDGIVDQNLKTYKQVLKFNTAVAQYLANPLQFYVDTTIVIPPDINNLDS